MKLSRLIALALFFSVGLALQAEAQTFNYAPPALGSTQKVQRDDLALELTGINTDKVDFVDIDTSAEILAIITNETGTGALVFATSPTLVSPALGTPSALTLTNATGLPVAGLSDATANGRSLISAANYAAMRGLLDLEAGTDFYSMSAANAAFQPLDADLTAVAGVTTATYGRALLAVSDEATLKALINAEAGVDFQAFDADLTLLAAGTYTDPNLDQFVWWDDSQGRFEFATIADLATEAAPAAGDYLTLYGAEGDVRKVNWSDLPGAGAGLSASDIDTSAELAAIVTDETGTGILVLATNPALAGNPTAPTASVGDADTSIATTAFVKTKTESLCVALSDEISNLTVGTAKVTWRMPYAFTLTDVRLSVNTAPTGGTLLAVDVNEGAGAGTTILSTKLTLDASEFTSTTAATPRVISDTSLADDANMTADIDAIGSTIPGKGAKICLIGYQT